MGFAHNQLKRLVLEALSSAGDARSSKADEKHRNNDRSSNSHTGLSPRGIDAVRTNSSSNEHHCHLGPTRLVEQPSGVFIALSTQVAPQWSSSGQLKLVVGPLWGDFGGCLAKSDRLHGVFAPVAATKAS